MYLRPDQTLLAVCIPCTTLYNGNDTSTAPAGGGVRVLGRTRSVTEIAYDT